MDNSKGLLPGDPVSLHTAIDYLFASVKNAFNIPKDALNKITEAVDKETRKLQAIITSLREHLNKLSPVWIFPDEVLLLIFQAMTELQDDQKQKTRNAARISQVCRRWRTICLNFSSFWDTISSEDASAWTCSILERNRKAPLHILWDVPRFDNLARIEPLKLVLEQWNPLESLSLALSSNELDELEDYFFSDGLHLKSLTITHHKEDQGSSDLIWTPMEDQFYFPQSPLLRKVRLENVHLPWPDQVHEWPALTSLHIVHAHHPTTGLLSLSDLLEILTILSHLESLTLENVIGPLQSFDGNLALDASRLSIDPTAPVTTRTLEIPNLRKLSAEIPNDESLVELLRHIKVPPQCRLHLIVRPRRVVDAPTVDPDILVKAALALALHRDSVSWKKIVYCEHDVHGAASVYAETATFYSRIHLDERNLKPRQSVLSVFEKCANVRQVEVLSIGLAQDLHFTQRQTWSALSSNFPSISSIELLQRWGSLSLATELDSSLFPQLERIEMTSVLLRHEEEVLLAEKLRGRRSKGLGLKKLTFRTQSNSGTLVDWTNVADEVEVRPKLLPVDD